MSRWDFDRYDNDHDDRYERDDDDRYDHDDDDRYDHDDYHGWDDRDDDDHGWGDDDHGSGQEGYQFAFTGNTISAVYAIENGRVEFERLDANESWTFDGAAVTKVEAEHGILETSTYTDLDGDGIYTISGQSYDLAPASATKIPSASQNWSADRYDSYEHTAYTAPETSYHFDVVNGAVSTATRVVNGYERNIRLDWDESWVLGREGVSKVETDWDEIETTLYTDDNFDGAFTQSLEIEVKTDTSPRSHEKFQFMLADGSSATGATLYEGDTIASALEANYWGWRAERLDYNEALDSVQIGADIYVVKTELDRRGEIEFTLYRDDDADGLWTEVADGSAMSDFIDPTGAIDFARIEDSDILASSYSIVG